MVGPDGTKRRKGKRSSIISHMPVRLDLKTDCTRPGQGLYRLPLQSAGYCDTPLVLWLPLSIPFFFDRAPFRTLPSPLHPALLLLQPLLRRPLRVLLSLPFLFSSSVVAWLWEERAYRATLCHQTACSLFSWSGRLRVNADIIYGFLSECIPASFVSRDATSVLLWICSQCGRAGNFGSKFQSFTRVLAIWFIFQRNIFAVDYNWHAILTELRVFP